MTSESFDLGRTVDLVVEALHEHGVSHFVTGSVAGSMHGEFRATNDIDIVADMSRAQFRGVMQRLRDYFTMNVDAAELSFFSGASCNVISAETFLKVDFFPARGEFEQNALTRVTYFSMPGATRRLAVASLEDIVLAKLRWYRAGDEQSGVQLRDIERLVALNRDALDMPYLRVWAARLRVDDLLQRLVGV